MSNNNSQFMTKQMDRRVGLDNLSHRTKIVATVGPACDTTINC
jgi:pyruvate kinase